VKAASSGRTSEAHVEADGSGVDLKATWHRDESISHPTLVAAIEGR
jgi:hypothetical protein